MKPGSGLAIALLATIFGSSPAGARSVPRDAARIMNSGSTNTAPYEITIWSGGNVNLDSRGAVSAARIDAQLTHTFFRDVKASKIAAGTGRPCMKSASFGTHTFVRYHGWRSPDLSCPGTAALVALGADVRAIAAASGAGAAGRLMPMLPNEHRRIPDESTPSPVPSSAP